MVADGFELLIARSLLHSGWCADAVVGAGIGIASPVVGMCQAAISIGDFGTPLRRASSASTTGESWHLMRASSIARPEAPVMSVATEESLLPESSTSVFSSRWISRERT